MWKMVLLGTTPEFPAPANSKELMLNTKKPPSMLLPSNRGLILQMRSRLPLPSIQHMGGGLSSNAERSFVNEPRSVRPTSPLTRLAAVHSMPVEEAIVRACAQ